MEKSRERTSTLLYTLLFKLLKREPTLLLRLVLIQSFPSPRLVAEPNVKNKVYLFLLPNAVDRTEGCYIKVAYGNISAENIIAWAYLKRCTAQSEWSEGCDRGVPKAEAPLQWTYHMGHNNNRWILCSYWIITERTETTSWKNSTKIRRWNCQAIQTNICCILLCRCMQ